jgi:amidohydrolase
VTALQQIASRNVHPLESIVVSVTKFHAGTAHNIIPMDATLGGTVRTLLPEIQNLAERRMTEIATHIAQAHGCEAEVRYKRGYPVTRNDPAAVDIFNATASAAIGAERVLPMANPVMGGEDFAYYGQQVPACFFALGLVPPNTESVPGGPPMVPQLHQPTFDFNDEALPLGIELFCALALR